MSKVIPVRLLDRSRRTKDWYCARSRYLGYEYAGRGLRPETTNLALSTGLLIHDAMAAIATYTQRGEAVPIDTIANLAYTQMYEALIPEDIISQDSVDYAKEQATLTEGLIRGFYRHTWPILMSLYPKIVAIEQEVEYALQEPIPCPHCFNGVEVINNDVDNLGRICTKCGGSGWFEPGYVFMAKPDLLVEDQTGSIVYLEYKSTSSKKTEWVNSWDTAVQLHSSIKAVKQTLGIEPAYVQIVGLYKGWVSYKKQSSPFCYAYKKAAHPPFTPEIISYEYKSGLKRTPTWELEGGVKKWVEDMPSEVLVDQFPMTPVISVNEDLVEAFFRQTLAREKEIYTAMQGELTPTVMDKTFSQVFEKCNPSFGYACEFRKICHGPDMDPLENGFAYREPHHQRELDQFNEKG